MSCKVLILGEMLKHHTGCFSCCCCHLLPLPLPPPLSLLPLLPLLPPAAAYCQCCLRP